MTKMNRCKLLGAVAGILLGAVVGSASARTFSTYGQTLRTVFFLFLREREAGERLQITGGFGTYACALTLEGSLHARTISKVVSSLVGYINRADMAQCSSGGLIESRVLREGLPWHVRYRSFTGTLPSIGNLAVSIIGFAMQIREGPFGLRCLGSSTAEQPLGMTYTREGGGALTAATASGTLRTACGEGISLTVTFEGR